MALTWFKHDVRARGDPCFSPLLARHGMAGYGVYWAVVEIADDEGLAGIHQFFHSDSSNIVTADSSGKH